MLFYLIVSILIITGLCLFFYAAGFFIGNGRNKKMTSAQAQDTKKLEAIIEEKNKELEAQNKLTENTLKEYQQLLMKSRKESNKRADEQREEVLNVIKLKKRISRLEDELKKNGIDISDVRFMP